MDRHRHIVVLAYVGVLLILQSSQAATEREFPVNTQPPAAGRCPRIIHGVEWVQYGDKCYLFKPDDVTVSQATINCATRRSGLASIHSNKENKFIMDQMKTHNSSNEWWIGLDRKSGGNWKWTDGSDADYFSWKSGEPSRVFGEENCVVAHSDTRGWNDISCNTKFRYVCMVNRDGSCLPDTNGEVWMAHENKCYLFMNDEVTMSTAQDQCSKRGSELASVYSDRENEFIMNQTETQKSGSWWWIGLVRNESGWIWTDGSEAAFVNWRSGEPNNAAQENCVEMITENGRWNDASCEGKQGYVCMLSTGQPTTASTPMTPGFVVGAVGLGLFCVLLVVGIAILTVWVIMRRKAKRSRNTEAGNNAGQASASSPPPPPPSHMHSQPGNIESHVLASQATAEEWIYEQIIDETPLNGPQPSEYVGLYPADRDSERSPAEYQALASGINPNAAVTD